jgi:nucleoside 2-deoxyribosyltransferase
VALGQRHGLQAPKRIYVAGFDVFRPNAVEHGQWLRGLCAQYGFERLSPLGKDVWAYSANKAR